MELGLAADLRSTLNAPFSHSTLRQLKTTQSPLLLRSRASLLFVLLSSDFSYLSSEHCSSNGAGSLGFSDRPIHPCFPAIC